MDETPKPPLADDPEFLDSLLELDRGVVSSASGHDAGRRPELAIQEAVARGAEFRPSSRVAETAVAPPLLLDLFPPLPPYGVTPGPDRVAPPQGSPPESPRTMPAASVRLPPRVDEAPAPPPVAAVQVPDRVLKPGVATEEPPVALPDRGQAVAPDRAAPATPTPGGPIESRQRVAGDLASLYHRASHELAIQDALAAIRRGDRFIVVTGGDGMGKTTFCRALAAQADRRTLVSLVREPAASVDDLLAKVLVDLGVMSAVGLARPGSEAEPPRDLAPAFQGFLASLAGIQATALLVLDDAHRVSPEILAAVARWCDSDSAGGRLQLALAGKPSLDRLLRLPALREFDERVASRSVLEPLDEEEVAGYIAHRAGVNGATDAGFEREALERMYELSEGVPGTLNRLCDRTLEVGRQHRTDTIGRELVEAAGVELKLAGAMPRTPWIERLVVWALLLALALVGAGAAAWVFRAPFSRLVMEWQRLPPPPVSPDQQAPQAAPLPPPPDDLAAGGEGPR